MANEQRYTAREMREVSEGLVDSCVADYISILVGHGNLKVVKGDRIVAMLRQAADAEEENAQLKARLEAVVKIMESRENWFSCRNCALEVLRAARGEGGAE